MFGSLRDVFLHYSGLVFHQPLEFINPPVDFIVQPFASAAFTTRQNPNAYLPRLLVSTLYQSPLQINYAADPNHQY
jgi:hypothetical protein